MTDLPSKTWGLTSNNLDRKPSHMVHLGIIIELDDGKKFNRKDLYLMVKTHGFPVKIFP